MSVPSASALQSALQMLCMARAWCAPACHIRATAGTQDAQATPWHTGCLASGKQAPSSAKRRCEGEIELQMATECARFQVATGPSPMSPTPSRQMDVSTGILVPNTNMTDIYESYIWTCALLDLIDKTGPPGQQTTLPPEIVHLPPAKVSNYEFNRSCNACRP